MIRLLGAVVATLVSVAGGKSPRFVLFKVARTGSTWLSDLLVRQPAVGFFAHEAHACHSKRHDAPELVTAQDIAYRTLWSILGRPSCNMSCSETAAWDDRGAARWADGEDLVVRGTPACLKERAVGFDIEPYHELWGGAKALSFVDHWPGLLRLPNVRAVVFARTNQVKHAVSGLRVRALVDLCDTHKVLANSTQAGCYERHRTEIAQPVRVDAPTLAHDAYRLGAKWEALRRDVEKAAGRAPLFLFYEALQRDARKELARLFGALGLGAAAAAPLSDSLKIGGDDLRTELRDFARVVAQFSKKHGCLSPMLRARDAQLFPAICLETGPGSGWHH